MKITIDTKTDSNEDIEKAVILLNSLIEDSYNENRKEEPVVAEGMMNMFNDDSSDNNTEDQREEKNDSQDSEVKIIQY